jgi:hypothetical protein
MPSYIEYWQTLSYSTCQQYKSYKNIVRFRKNLSKHATKNGVTLINSPGDNDYQNFINNIIKPGARRAAEDNGIAFRAKRVRLPKIEIAQAPVVVDNAMELQADAAIVPTIIIHEIEQQPMMQAQALIQEADIALIAQEQRAEQPMEQEQWAEQPMVDAALVQAQALIAPPSAHLPNANGARRVVPTNTLVLNGLVIEVDPDTFMVNATMMCKAAGKRWNDYQENSKSTAYIYALESKTGIPVLDLIKSNRGGNHLGTMVHLLIALDLASWLSPEVKAQFNMWNVELLLTGRVELGNEMNVQQLEDAWRRINEELQAKASADVSAAQDLCREIILQKNELELRLATIQDAQQLTKAAQEELMAIKVREDLEAAIQFQANTTAPTIATYKEGDNVLYLARIDETKFKYGHTKNLKQRLEAHGRRGVYPTLELVWIVKSNNGVASEDQLHAYVKKKKIIAEYGTQREIISLESVDDLERMLKKMNKCALPRADADIDIRRMEEETKRMEITEKTKQMEINAKTKQMEINPKTMLMQMLANKTITFEQYLQIKD